MTSEVCAVILAAGEGRRLRPFTLVRPKALCPVGNVPLLDSALDRVHRLGLYGQGAIAVNACHLAAQVAEHVNGRAHVVVEPAPPLGTAGGLANLRDWVDGRPVLVCNADAYLSDPDVSALLDGWDGGTVRLLGVPAGTAMPEFGAYRFAGLSLLPWRDVAALAPGVADLVRTTWRPAERDGRLQVIPYRGTYLDTGTPRDYLAANLHAVQDGVLIAPDATVTGRLHAAVIGAGATVAGSVTRGVVWPGGYVGPDEELFDVVRAGAALDSMTWTGSADRQESSR